MYGQDVVLATDEAVSNVIEHAYPYTQGVLTLFAARTGLAEAVRITWVRGACVVSDHGLWRPPQATRDFADAAWR